MAKLFFFRSKKLTIIAGKIFTILWTTFTVCIVYISIYLYFCFFLSVIPVNRYAAENEGEITIYILSNGVHTDIVVPIISEIMDWTQYVRIEDTLAKDFRASYVAFGWGDKGFYLETPTWAELKFTVGFKAVFGLSTSAIHVTFYRQLAENEQCIKIKISTEQYAHLVNFISDSFRKDQSGKTIPINTDAIYGYNDAFYEAAGRYNLFKTCNTWTNNALKSCSQKACLWTAFDKGIFYQYHK